MQTAFPGDHDVAAVEGGPCAGSGPAARPAGQASAALARRGGRAIRRRVGVIRILEPAVADQIAAGEVVERPASVLKELVENALDAGATRVDVDVADGGLLRLVVDDDGGGMDDDDAVLCFSRHATSKLRAADDLRRIGTFGFRGEALAAIASVARVRLTTRRPDAARAFAVVVEAGRVVQVGEAGLARGTRVEVNDLFFNVPARRKFLKTPRTEAGHIEDALLSCALCRPDVAFRLVVDGRVTLDLPAVPAALDHPARIDRVVRCLGDHLRPWLFPVQGRTELLALSGYVVAPLETRRDLQGVQLSVNGRPVSDRALVQAVRAAFRTLLEVGRQPIVALDLSLDPELVDVNVHPRKAEVRFADPRRVAGHLISLLSEFLVTTPWLDRPAATRATMATRAAPPSRATYALRSTTGTPTTATPTTATPTTTSDDDDAAAAARARVKEALSRFAGRPGGAQTTTGATTGRATSATTGHATSATTGHATSATTSAATAPLLASAPGRAGASSFAALRVVGQVGGTYLVLDGPEGMVVIDQHAAHERVVFERLRAARQAASETAAPTQPLLLPLTLDLASAERSALDDDDVRAELLRHGIDVEGFGPKALVRALPPGLDGRRATGIVRDALAELGRGDGGASLQERSDAVCARLACHAAVRAGDALAPAQVRALLEDLDRIDLGAHCPHGRPVVRTVAFAELARWFDR